MVGEVKIKTEIAELCRDIPPEFTEIMTYTLLQISYLKKLEFKSEPDYKYILSLLSRAATNNHILMDKVFEWTDK